MKFSKLTTIWYMRTSLYPYFEFNVHFFKIFIIHIFFSKFGPKIRTSPSWLKFSTLLYGYFNFSVNFFKIFVMFFLANFFLKFELLQFNWNLVQGYIAICLLLIASFYGQILSQDLTFLQINWNLVQGYIATHLLRF